MRRGSPGDALHEARRRSRHGRYRGRVERAQEVHPAVRSGPSMSSRLKLLGVLLGCLVGALWPALATATNQEPAGINLGATSFLDGFGRNEEGFTYLVYAQYARSRQITGDDGNALSVCNGAMGCGGPGQPVAEPVFKHPSLDVYLLVNQLAYTLPNKLF